MVVPLSIANLISSVPRLASSQAGGTIRPFAYSLMLCRWGSMTQAHSDVLHSGAGVRSITPSLISWGDLRDQLRQGQQYLPLSPVAVKRRRPAAPASVLPRKLAIHVLHPHWNGPEQCVATLCGPCGAIPSLGTKRLKVGTQDNQHIDFA